MERWVSLPLQFSFMIYFAALLIAFVGFMPSSLYFELYISNQAAWTFLVLTAAFGAFFLLFQKINPFIKIVAVGGLLNCFFSLSFVHSASAYISVVGACYFYWVCTRIKDWDLIFKILMSLVLLNCFLMAMQAIGRDSLLNFGMGKNLVCFGTIGSRMQLECLLIISSAILLQSRYRMAIWGLVGAVGLYLIIFKMNAVSQGGFLHNPFISRWPVWKETIAFANQYPWTGWGIGTFKIFYHVMSKLHTQPWAEAHNDFIQVLYETGYPGLVLMMVYLGSLIWKLKMQRQWKLLTGLSLILLDMMVHFPLREFQCFAIVIAFLAFCETRLVGSQVE